MIKKFRKKMPIIEAVEFIDTTENLDEITEFLSDKGIKEFKVDYSDRNNPVLIVEKNGVIRVKKGEYLVNGAMMYSCRPNIFEKNFEEVKE